MREMRMGDNGESRHSHESSSQKVQEHAYTIPTRRIEQPLFLGIVQQLFSLTGRYLRASCKRSEAVVSLICSRPFRQASQARSLAGAGSRMVWRALARPWD